MKIIELLEKAREFASKENKLTLERYNQIKKEWNRTTDKRNKGEITKEEALIIHQSLMKETEEAEIKFDNEEDFINFSNHLSSFAGIPLAIVLKQVEHEIEHSKPYKKEGIKSYFGWHNLSEPTGNPFLKAKRFQPFHKPFGEKYDSFSSFEKDKLLYKSLKVVSLPSKEDREAINELEERHGSKVKQ